MSDQTEIAIDGPERDALRRCAQLLWLNRDTLGLSAADREQALIGWMAIGNQTEGSSAAALLALMREQDRAQKNFDDLLGGAAVSNGHKPA